MVEFPLLVETGRLTPEEAQRWEDIKRTYCRNVRLRGLGDDAKFAQMMAQFSSFADGLDTIGKSLDRGLDRLNENALGPESENALSEDKSPREIHVVTKVPSSVTTSTLMSAVNGPSAKMWGTVTEDVPTVDPSDG